ncbi:MAG: SRPBCC domain-containing protein [Patescibacteria group bacterium]|nr:SRPBCC domain-containing protein [Patescibacteria group bacterium]
MEKEITITRLFDASRERVWKAWTDPERLSQWWGPRGVTNPVCEVDPRVGGAVHIVMLAGKELGALAGQRWPMQGTFLEVVEPERLDFENNAVAEDGTVMLEGETTVVLEDMGGKTRLTLTTRAKGMVPQAPQMLEGMEAGWTQSIDKLGELLAH